MSQEAPEAKQTEQTMNVDADDDIVAKLTPVLRDMQKPGTFGEVVVRFRDGAAAVVHVTRTYQVREL